jgi:hypothetical protein
MFDIFLFEKKLPIQVRKVYGIQVKESYVAEAGQDDILHCHTLYHHYGMKHKNMIFKDLQSSHPIPPAPTSRTFVSDNLSQSSGPKMACA